MKTATIQKRIIACIKRIRTKIPFFNLTPKVVYVFPSLNKPLSFKKTKVCLVNNVAQIFSHLKQSKQSTVLTLKTRLSLLPYPKAATE
jgi:hypothetical protein